MKMKMLCLAMVLGSAVSYAGTVIEVAPPSAEAKEQTFRFLKHNAYFMAALYYLATMHKDYAGAWSTNYKGGDFWRAVRYLTVVGSVGHLAKRMGEYILGEAGMIAMDEYAEAFVEALVKQGVDLRDADVTRSIIMETEA